MIKWKILLEDWKTKKNIWSEQTNLRIFNLVWPHTADHMRSQLESQLEWDETLAAQNGVELLKSMYALHHKQDDSRPIMQEVVELDQQLYLCTQRQNQSNVDYMKAFKNAIDAINSAGGLAGVTARAIELVCQEQGLEYTSFPHEVMEDSVMIPNPKKIAIEAEAREQYLLSGASDVRVIPRKARTSQERYQEQVGD